MPIPDRATLLEWLAAKAEDRDELYDTAAIRMLLEELRRDGDDAEQAGTLDALDNITEIGTRRKKAS